MLSTRVGASLEVLRHHSDLHKSTCQSVGAVNYSCEHDRAVIIACGTCGTSVFAAVAIGVDCCHVTQVINRLPLSGVWHQVSI